MYTIYAERKDIAYVEFRGFLVIIFVCNLWLKYNE